MKSFPHDLWKSKPNSTIFGGKIVFFHEKTPCGVLINYFLTASFSNLPALNAGVSCAGTTMRSPVLGSTPLL
mgnify:CR=1 FL=1|jgi:hypothetical protein